MNNLELKSYIHTVLDFPKPGIRFRDITPLLATPAAFNTVIDKMAGQLSRYDVEGIAGIEARGFIFGSAMAAKLNLPFFLVRKSGKLPRKTARVEYALEYGSASVEMQLDAVGPGDRVLVFDDLIATGGTILAACTLVKKLGASVSEAAALIDLPDLQGSTLIQDSGVPVHTLMAFEGL